MIYVWIALVTVLTVYSAIGTYQNRKNIYINAKDICEIVEIIQELCDKFIIPKNNHDEQQKGGEHDA